MPSARRGPCSGRVLNPPLALDLLAIRADTATVVDDMGRFLKSDEFVSDLVTAIMSPS